MRDLPLLVRDGSAMIALPLGHKPAALRMNDHNVGVTSRSKTQKQAPSQQHGAVPPPPPPPHDNDDDDDDETDSNNNHWSRTWHDHGVTNPRFVPNEVHLAAYA